MQLNKLKKHSPTALVRLCFALFLLSEREDRIDMPRRLVDDLEGEVIDEEILEGGFENRLGTRPQGFESLSLRHILHNFV